MRWFYIKRGKELEHDLVDDQVLHEMAEAGTLSRDDLIWPEEAGSGWALAETLHGLFPKEKATLEVEVERPEEVFAQVQEDNRIATESFTAKRRRKRRRRLVVIVVLILIAAGWHYREKFLELLPVQDEVRLLVPIDEEAIAAAHREAAAEIERAKAARMVADDKKQLEDFKSALERGKLDEASARKLMELWFEYGDLGELPAYLAGILDSGKALTDSVRVSVLTLAAVMNDDQLIARSVNDYQKAITEASSVAPCLEFASVAAARISSARSMLLLNTFLERQPEAFMVLLEIAAMQSQDGSKKEALASLKTACKIGGDAVKAKAIADKRFDSVRESSSFRRCTGK